MKLLETFLKKNKKTLDKNKKTNKIRYINFFYYIGENRNGKKEKKESKS